MEPRLLRRGNRYTADKPLKTGRLQWSHAFSDVETHRPGLPALRLCRFNGATPSQTWKRRAAAHWQAGNCGFNGATPSQTWKLRRPTRTRRTGQNASMEPRLLRRGNIAGHFLPQVAVNRFNGATPSQTWKHLYRYSLHVSIPELQWSHAFSDVETASGAFRIESAIVLQWSHAFSDVETKKRA